MIRLSAQFEGFTGVLSMKGVDGYKEALDTAEAHMPVIENAKKVTLERV